MDRGGRVNRIVLGIAMAIAATAPLVSQRGQPAPAAAQPQVAAPPPAALGRINGVVYVLGTTTPIANVSISVAVPAGPLGQAANGPLPASDPASFTAKTDSSGHFTVDNVPAGNRSVMAQLEGYFGPAQNGIYPASVRRPAMVVSQQTVEVKIELIPGGAVSGHVYNSDGSPVSDTQVQALRLAYQEGKLTLQTVNSKSTDDHGEYRIYRLPPGDYYFAANPRPGGGPRGNRPVALPLKTFYPDTADPSRAVTLTIRGGDEIGGTNISIRTETGATLSGQIVTSLPLSGQTVGPRGATRDITVTNSTLTLSPHDRNSFSTFNNTSNVSMLAPNLGKFQIRNVPPGVYDLFASLPDATGWGNQQPAGFATQPVGYGRFVVDVRGGSEIEGIVINVHAGVDTRGRITVNGGTENVQNVRLQLEPDDSASNLQVYQQVSRYIPYVDENGRFSIPAVPEGRYRIAVSFADGPVANDGRGGTRGQRGRGAQEAPAGQRGRGARGEPPPSGTTNPLTPINAYVEDIRQGGVSVYDKGLVVGSQSAGDIEVRIGTGPGTIQGTLLDAEQKPLATTSVFLVPSADRRANLQLYRTGSSDGNGQFRFNGIVPGQYEIFSWQEVVPGAFQNEEYLRRYAGRGTPVNVMRGATTMAQAHVIPSDKR